VIEVGQSEVGFTGGEPVSGELLVERLARDPLPPEEVLRYAIEIGAALNQMHLRGLVHGGLSPFSIRIASTGAQILPPLRGYDERAAAYRSPEQVRGEALDWRSDVFAYGALLYEMASGRRAFPGEGAELNDAILEQPVAGLMAKSPIHAAMESVIAGCLEKDPARRRQRIQNAVIELKLAGGGSWRRKAEVPNQLPRRRAGMGTAAAPAPAGDVKVARRPAYVSLEPPVRREALRRRLWAAGAVLIALAVLSIAVGLYLNQRLEYSDLRCHHRNTPAIRARPRSRRMDAFLPSRLWVPKVGACSGCGRWMRCTPT
jgi:hypothetical protein